MIQFNQQSTTISGFFGLTAQRKDELEAEFKKVRDEQRNVVLNDILKSVDETSGAKIGYHRVPVLSAYMAIAKTEAEQVFVAFMSQHELSYFTEIMNNAVEGAMIRSLMRR